MMRGGTTLDTGDYGMDVFMSRFAVVTTALGIVSAPGLAWACGCFAPGAASQPVVQAGERIVFATDGTTISAHIQIQYSGPAEEFAWLLPMPAVPELRLSSERLFDRLEASTRVETTVQTELCATGPVPLECVPPSPEPANNNSVSNNNMGAEPPFGAVREEAVGPFDTAVLPADDLTMMTDWRRARRTDERLPYHAERTQQSGAILSFAGDASGGSSAERACICHGLRRSPRSSSLLADTSRPR